MINVSDIIETMNSILTIIKITSVIDNRGNNIDTRKMIEIEGNIQNYAGKTLEILKDGQRFWNYKQLQVNDDSKYYFDVNDRLIYENIEYKVIEQRNNKEYGYIKYILKENYQ